MESTPAHHSRASEPPGASHSEQGWLAPTRTPTCPCSPRGFRVPHAQESPRGNTGSFPRRRPGHPWEKGRKGGGKAGSRLPARAAGGPCKTHLRLVAQKGAQETRGASAPGDAAPSGTCQRGGSERVRGRPQKGKGWPSRAAQSCWKQRRADLNALKKIEKKKKPANYFYISLCFLKNKSSFCSSGNAHILLTTGRSLLDFSRELEATGGLEMSFPPVPCRWLGQRSASGRAACGTVQGRSGTWWHFSHVTPGYNARHPRPRAASVHSAPAAVLLGKPGFVRGLLALIGAATEHPKAPCRDPAAGNPCLISSQPLGRLARRFCSLPQH